VKGLSQLIGITTVELIKILINLGIPPRSADEIVIPEVIDLLCVCDGMRSNERGAGSDFLSFLFFFFSSSPFFFSLSPFEVLIPRVNFIVFRTVLLQTRTSIRALSRSPLINSRQGNRSSPF
jgi:hypothetical protein